MLARLLNNIAFNFYKTKWTKPLKRDRTKSFQIPIHRWIIVRGDKVKIRSGPDRGKIGRVVKVIRKLNRVVVKGVNITSYMKKIGNKLVPTKKASSIHVSNVGLYDYTIKKAVRIRFGYDPKTGQKLRVAKQSGRVMLKPKFRKNKRSVRGKKRKTGLKDTPSLLAHKVTYEGEDFQSIKRDFEQFIKQKEQRQKYLVFKE